MDWRRFLGVMEEYSHVYMFAGYLIIGLSLLFFLLASYAVFFSALLPSTGYYVSIFLLESGRESVLNYSGRSGARWSDARHTLQVFLPVHHPARCRVCHRKLGRLAVLPQFLILDIRIDVSIPRYPCLHFNLTITAG